MLEATLFKQQGIKKVVFVASVAAYNSHISFPPDKHTVLESVYENDENIKAK